MVGGAQATLSGFGERSQAAVCSATAGPDLQQQHLPVTAGLPLLRRDPGGRHQHILVQLRGSCLLHNVCPQLRAPACRLLGRRPVRCSCCGGWGLSCREGQELINGPAQDIMLVLSM